MAFKAVIEEVHLSTGVVLKARMGDSFIASFSETTNGVVVWDQYTAGKQVKQYPARLFPWHKIDRLIYRHPGDPRQGAA